MNVTEIKAALKNTDWKVMPKATFQAVRVLRFIPGAVHIDGSLYDLDNAYQLVGYQLVGMDTLPTGYVSANSEGGAERRLWKEILPQGAGELMDMCRENDLPYPDWLWASLNTFTVAFATVEVVEDKILGVDDPAPDGLIGGYVAYVSSLNPLNGESIF